MIDDSSDVTRRRFLGLIVAAPVVLAAASPLVRAALAATEEARRAQGSSGPLDPTPECGDDDEPTPSATAGPFFKTHSPRRASLLEPGIAGTRLVVSGRVFAPDCRPLSGALLDFWQADDDGEYDNDGHRLRGHQFADAHGRYRLETIVPGQYPGRTRHLHVRVQAPKGRMLTTQLYFPDEARNRRDFLFDPALVMTMSGELDRGRSGRFHFVLSEA